MPQAEIEDGSAHDRRAGNIFLVARQEDSARRRPCPVLGKDQFLGLEGVPDVLRISGRTAVEHLVEAAIPFLDLMRRRPVRFRQGAQPVKQAARSAGRFADTKKVKQRPRRFPIEQAMHEGLDVNQGFGFGRPTH